MARTVNANRQLRPKRSSSSRSLPCAFQPGQHFVHRLVNSVEKLAKATDSRQRWPTITGTVTVGARRRVHADRRRASRVTDMLETQPTSFFLLITGNMGGKTVIQSRQEPRYKISVLSSHIKTASHHFTWLAAASKPKRPTEVIAVSYSLKRRRTSKRDDACTAEPHGQW